MTRPVITFDAEAHSYTVNAAPVPSVTKVITRILGSGFERIQDPAYYMQRGRSLHACAALLAQGLDYDPPAGLEGHDMALRAFWRDVHPVVVDYEKPVASAVYGYAGTLDLCAYTDRLTVIFDYKSSLSEERTRIQMGAYSLAYKESFGVDVKLGVGVWLRGNGTYRMTKPADLLPARRDFLNLLGTFNILQRVEKTQPENDDV